MTRKILVVGNGSIGMMISISIARANPSWSVSVVGPADRRFSASTAAGAMVNVYAEIEHLPDSQMVFADRLLEVGKRATRKWAAFLRATDGSHVKTAPGTAVVLKRGAFSFEEKNFHAMSERVLEDRAGRLEDHKSLEYFAGSRAAAFQSVLKIDEEFAMDSHALMRHLDSVAKSLGVTTADVVATKVHPELRQVQLADGTSLHSDQIIVAAGAFSGTLFDNEVGLMEMFQGIGTALVAHNFPSGSVRPRDVIRTVNRGGAQCGVHLVPIQQDSLYIGAGNTVTKVREPQVRFETVAYLLDTAQKEFFGRDVGYALEGDVRIGLRPRSLDGYPMIGPISKHENVFVATATNRAGLTWAPEIADYVVSWLAGKSESSPLDGWEPDRQPLTLSDTEQLLEHYVESRIGAGLDHGTVQNTESDIARARSELTSVGRDLGDPAQPGSAPAGTHPDNWAAAAHA